MGLILSAAVSATGLVGAVSLTAALAKIGPGGMVGGVLTLGVAAFAAKGIAEYGFEAVFIGVAKELIKRGESVDSMIEKVDILPVFKSLKLTVKEELDKAK